MTKEELIKIVKSNTEVSWQTTHIIEAIEEHDKWIRAETVDKCSELFAETLSNITNICGTNCPIKCNWGTEKTCKDMCKKWFWEQLKGQNK